MYRRDAAGEMVRQPALQLTGQGRTRQAWRACWSPDQFVFLARVLGFDKPEGVLE